MNALGFLEVPFLSVAALVADAAAKAAHVNILGLEATGNENILIRLCGTVADVEASVTAANNEAIRLGCSAVTRVLTQPADEMRGLIHFENTCNPLYGGRDQFLPLDFTNQKNQAMNNKQDAIGIIETQGLTTVLQATDAMLKAANVLLVGKEKIGAAYVTVIVKGDVAAVTAAVEAGAKAIGQLGKLVAAHVIARPHDDLCALLPK